MRTVMLVATHKQYDLPQGTGFYLPVHVGHALNPVDLGYQPDDSGDNISADNRSYCELTALYWAWRNLDCDIIGLSHYRRYFAGSLPGPGGTRILSREEAEQLMGRRRIVLSSRRHYLIETIENHYRHAHFGEDLDAMIASVGAVSPQLVPALERVLAGRSLSLYNMFLMQRDDFDRYAGWLFDVLAATAERLPEASGRSAYQQRTLGYLGERLLNVWALANADSLQVTHRKVVNVEGEPKLRKMVGLVQRKLGWGGHA